MVLITDTIHLTREHMKPEEEGGLGYKEKIDWVNEYGNMDIKY